MKSPASRCALLAVGIAAMAAGIVIITKSNLGTSPISSLGYVLSIAFPTVSYGMFMLAWNVTLLAGQIALLGRRFKAAALLQVPLSVLFTLGIDGFAYVLSPVAPETYAQSALVLAAGIVVLALGVACTVTANVATNSGEAFVCAVTSKTGWNFGRTKVGFDLACVAVAAIASLALLGGIHGIREGTIVSAAATGLLVNVFVRLMGGVRAAFPNESPTPCAPDSTCGSSDSVRNRGGSSAS